MKRNNVTTTYKKDTKTRLKNFKKEVLAKILILIGFAGILFLLLYLFGLL